MNDENNPKSIEERFFNNRNFDEIEDYEIVGDEYISVGVPKVASKELKLHILAAIKAERLGSKSVDKVYREYIDDWDFIANSSSWEKLFSEIFECVRHEVGMMLIKLQHIDKINRIGLIVARSALFRLQNSFKSVLLLIRKGHCIEAMCISRLILEQIAWAYNIYSLDENEIIKTKPTESISKLKKFYSTAGTFYWIFRRLEQQCTYFA
jgi:hypothetical protein